MRITSLNLRGFFEWEPRMPRILDYLRQVDPDVILFQEVVWLPEVSPFSQVELLNHELRFPARHESITRLQRGRRTAVYREGLGLLAKPHVVASDALVLKHEKGDPHHRIVQLADLEVDGQPWLLANVHLSVRDDFAIEHLKEVLAAFRARGEQRITGGDFNVDHLERFRELWRADAVLTTELEQYESHPGTHENDDYFLVPDAYRVTRVTVSGDDLSDHRAITIDVLRGSGCAGMRSRPT